MTPTYLIKNGSICVSVPSFRVLFKFKECFRWASVESGVSRVIVWTKKAA